MLEFGHPGCFVGFGQPAPPGMPPGDTVQPGGEQPVAVRCTMIMSPLTTIERGYDKYKSASLIASIYPDLRLARRLKCHYPGLPSAAWMLG